MPSMKCLKWTGFHLMVVDHIENYVVPQYGDDGADPASEYDLDDCIKQAQRYLSRIKTNQRPEGRSRDLLKAAHWIQMAYDRLNQGEGS